MRVLVTGASGYVGSVLMPRLWADGHEAIAIDTMWFGNYLPDIVPGTPVPPTDIRELFAMDVDAVIHLAAVSNDESVEADRVLSRSVNLDATEKLVALAKSEGVRRFVFASTSAVYGHSPQPMRETDPCAPIYDYAKWKLEAERCVLDAGYTVVRPAALYGHSPRMRFDLGVNVLTASAVCNGRIEVWGGEQMRSCLHVSDMADAYAKLIAVPREWSTGCDKLAGRVFNIGAENLSIHQIAGRVRARTNAPIRVKAARDSRSYQINSSAWYAEFGRPRYRVEHGITEIAEQIMAGAYNDPMGNPIYHNVRWMKDLQPV